MAGCETVVELTNDLAELDKLHQAVDAFAAAAGAQEKVRFQLKLAMEEIFVNIVTHGYEDGKKHRIRVIMAYEAPDLTVKVEDDGVAFDPVAAKAPDVTLPLARRGIGGLGVHLVKWCCDMTYCRKGRKNVLVIKKTIA